MARDMGGGKPGLGGGGLPGMPGLEPHGAPVHPANPATPTRAPRGGGAPGAVIPPHVEQMKQQEYNWPPQMGGLMPTF